jgi:hypothetical protein
MRLFPSLPGWTQQSILFARRTDMIEPGTFYHILDAFLYSKNTPLAAGLAVEQPVRLLGRTQRPAMGEQIATRIFRSPREVTPRMLSLPA